MTPCERSPIRNRWKALFAVIQTPSCKWEQTLGVDATLTAALLDRLLHRAHVIAIAGARYQLKERRQAGMIVGTLTAQISERAAIAPVQEAAA